MMVKFIYIVQSNLYNFFQLVLFDARDSITIHGTFSSVELQIILDLSRK